MKRGPIGEMQSAARVRSRYRRFLRRRGYPALANLTTAPELRFAAIFMTRKDMLDTTRPITTDDIWSAVRGLALFAKTEHELRRIRAAHAPNPLFASKVIVQAVDEVLASRRIMTTPRHRSTNIGE